MGYVLRQEPPLLEQIFTVESGPLDLEGEKPPPSAIAGRKDTVSQFAV